MGSNNVRHEIYARHDFGDFAQEFLRRNHEYGIQYRALIRAGAAYAPRARAMARDWALEFPVPP